MVIGDDLEYRIARLHIFSGFFVRRGCPIYTIAALDRATDLDVLSLTHSELFRRDMMVTECKSGGTAPLDRIFWLTGVRKYTGASQAFLVRKGTKCNIKDFAKECGVQILDLERITEIETALKIGENEWPGVSDKAFYEANVTSWNKAMNGETRYWELYQTLTCEVRFDDAFVGVNYLLSQLRQMTRHWTKPPTETYFRFLMSESIAQLAVFLMRIAERCFDLGASDRHGFITKGLTYGNMEPQYAERIMNSAYNMTRQAVLHYTNKFVDIDRTLFSMPVPPGTDQVVATVDDLLGAYPSSLNFPQICDLILIEMFMKQKETRGWLRRIFPQSDLSVRVDAVRKFIGTLVSMGACPSYVLDAITTTGKTNATEPKPTAQGAPSPAAPAEKQPSPFEAQAQPAAPTEPESGKADPKQANLDLTGNTTTKT
jgi:hypothetical protein